VLELSTSSRDRVSDPGRAEGGSAPRGAPVTGASARLRGPWRKMASFAAPVVAMAGVLVVWALHWGGVDLATQLYRVNLFRQYGFLVWDGSWYGGHYLLSYSVLFPPLGAALGLYGVAVLSVGAAAWAFSQLLRRNQVPGGVLPAVLFGAGMVVPVAIGQLAFVSGEAAALLALLAATRRRRWLAAALTICCPLLSQVAGAFLVLALVAWVLATPRGERRGLLTLTGLALAPMLVLDVLFPEPGWFPFWGSDVAIIVALCVVGLLVIPGRYRAVRIGLLLYGVATILLFVLPTPLGGNFGRLGEAVAPAAVAAWSLSSRRRAVALLVALPVLLWQWSPAWSAIQTGPQDPSRNSSYFQPLLTHLAGQATFGRLEIPATRNHWESAFAAPVIPLARGWERQVDVAQNALFYRSARLTASTYRDWLTDTGVAWVALPDAPLDYSARAEVALLRRPPPYLQLAWHNAHWRLWRVVDSPGLASGPAHVVSVTPDRVDLQATAAGVITVRVRYTSRWNVDVGRACVSQTPEGWTRVVVAGAQRVTLRISLTDHDAVCADSS